MQAVLQREEIDFIFDLYQYDEVAEEQVTEGESEVDNITGDTLKTKLPYSPY